MRVRGSLLLLFTLFTSGLCAILGIDLGQDFTKAVLVGPGLPFEIVMSADSKRKDVSGLAFKPLGKDGGVERLYGSATSSYCTRFPESCILNYKPLLGKSAQDPIVPHYLISHPGLDIVDSKNNRSTISFNVHNHRYPIEEVLAMNTQDIVGRATTLLKEKSPGGYSQIDGVAVTVPSYFTLAQRAAIKDAVELSGLTFIGTVDSGLAIAINYASKTEFDIGKEYHIIYDMGAGSTTATLVSFSKIDEKTPIGITVEGYAFDESLGGSYFTNAIANIIQQRFLENHKEVSSSKFQASHRSIAKIYQASEKAKLILSANTEAPISIESLFDDIDYKTTVTRQEFEEYLVDVSPRITDVLNSAIRDQFESSVQLQDIKSVIYAGGSTRVPFVQQHLLTLIGEDRVSKTINADEAAVLGTTLRAVQISKQFKAKEFIITERSPFTYRITFDDDEETTIFPIGSQYDTIRELDLTEKLINNKKLSFDLIEGTHRYSHHESSSFKEITEKLTFNESDCSSIRFVGKFSLSESRLVNFDRFEALCVNKTDSPEVKGGLLSKLNLQSSETEETIIKRSLISTKSKYLSSRPLGSASKLDLRSHLQTLNAKDQQRRQFSEKLNELEALLYSTRSYLNEEDVIAKGPESVVEECKSLVTEYLEWLDYDSEGATLKEVKERVEIIRRLVSQIREYIAQSSSPLDAAEFSDIHQKGVLASQKLQETLMSAGEDSLEMAKKFAELGLDYEKETKKLTKAARDFSPQSLDAISKALTKTFEKVKEVSEDEEVLGSHSREELFKLRKEALDRLQSVDRAEAQLRKAHSQRTKELQNILNRHIKAQKRAAEKAAEKANVEKEIDEEEAEDTSNQKAEHEEIVHDEL